jgi:dihydrofolate reductase
VAKLIYASIASLDGYTEDKTGSFEWSEPDEELHQYITDFERGIGTHLYGRRMYDTLAVWETDPSLEAQSPILADYARVWQASDKIVYSSTLEAPRTARTRIERRFDPEAVLRLVGSAQRDVGIGGPELAGHAFKAGLVDELHLFVVPVVLGGGKPALPTDMFVKLELLDEHRFAGGVVDLRYRVMR